MFKNIVFVKIILFVSILLVRCSNEPTEPDDCDNCTDLTGLYLGQELPGETPKIFKPFNNSDDIFEWNYVFSMNGEECAFTRVGGEYETSTIMMTHIEDEFWIIPEKAHFSNNDYNPTFSPDGGKLFFVSYRDFPNYTYSPIWVSTKTDNSWSMAEDTGVEGGYISVTNDGTLYHCNWINGTSHITRSRFINGNYQPIEILTAPIYSELYNDQHPFIAPDESYLIFDSEDRPRQNDCGLFISFKNDDGSWSEPVNMGSIITQRNAGMEKVTPDGKYLFFNDWYGDTYWVDASIIDKFRTNNGNNTVIDFDGNIYSTIKIGDQWWMAENLQTTHSSNGSFLNGVYVYNDNESYVAEYGRLYTWQAALDAEIPGWHLPSDEEWDILISMVGLNPADILRSGGSSGFNAKLGGLRLDSGEYGYLGAIGIYWTSTQSSATHSRVKLFVDGEPNVITDNNPIGGAKSVRYIKD